MSTFPVDKPAWAVSTLLKRPDDAIHRQKLQEALSNDDVKRLYALSGLKLSDMSNDADELARVLVDVNKLRDFLSHIQTVSISENVDSVEPLVRIAEPVEFSCKEPAGGLWQSEDPSLDLGEKVLETAKHRSGPYLVVED
ncbi:hypothetical protein LPJ59_001541 [Coemansia sp. RSA 2399]|nr:hypothetical protein LPJ59_001541 [Coemansia sp. RSA 2399]KAJ1906464.1 hypothetical protein LPJ81_001335 [Coemansia sp. IMI 209127]